MTVSDAQLQLANLWLAYLSGQFGKETLEWHKRNTPGFNNYVAERLADITGDEGWQTERTNNGPT